MAIGQQERPRADELCRMITNKQNHTAMSVNTSDTEIPRKAQSQESIATLLYVIAFIIAGVLAVVSALVWSSPLLFFISVSAALYCVDPIRV